MAELTHFIDIADHDRAWLDHVLSVAHELRAARRQGQRKTAILEGQTLAMFFEKPSLRTRGSFEQGVYELGGQAIVLQQAEVGLGKRESTADIARVLAGMVQGIMARVYDHGHLVEMTRVSAVPVINALSDRSHPCQALADLMTMQDEFGGELSGRRVAFVGDGNNVALSLAQGCAKFGVGFTLASPPEYRLPDESMARLRAMGGEVTIVDDPRAAVAQADVIYTDTFVSMGQEEEKERRLKAFAAYQVNGDLLAAAPERAIVMHCLPAYRGIEITDEVMDGPRSRVFSQAHNRLHAQKGLLAVMMGGR